MNSHGIKDVTIMVLCVGICLSLFFIEDDLTSLAASLVLAVICVFLNSLED